MMYVPVYQGFYAQAQPTPSYILAQPAMPPQSAAPMVSAFFGGHQQPHYSNGGQTTTISNQILVQVPMNLSAGGSTGFTTCNGTPQMSPVQFVDQYGQPVEQVEVNQTFMIQSMPNKENPVPLFSAEINQQKQHQPVQHFQVAASSPEMESKKVDQPVEKCCPLNRSSLSPSSRKMRQPRQRFAFTHELHYKGLYQEVGSGPFSRIRVWVNDRNLHYYDCVCGKRKPVQDLYKIKQHALRHEVEEHVCDVCGKVFKHHLQINAHMRVHKKAPTPVDDEKPSTTETSPSRSSTPIDEE